MASNAAVGKAKPRTIEIAQQTPPSRLDVMRGGATRKALELEQLQTPAFCESGAARPVRREAAVRSTAESPRSSANLPRTAEATRGRVERRVPRPTSTSARDVPTAGLDRAERRASHVENFDNLDRHRVSVGTTSDRFRPSHPASAHRARASHRMSRSPHSRITLPTQTPRPPPGDVA